MKNTKKIIPVKNYVILFIIIIITLLLCSYFSSWYQTNEEANMKKGIMSENLMQIKIEELDNYVLENPNKIIYLSSSNDETIKTYENKIYDYISDNNLIELFIYIDTSDIEIEKLVSILKKNSVIKDNVDYSISPNIYIVKDGKITEALYYQKENINSKDAIKYISENEDVL